MKQLDINGCEQFDGKLEDKSTCELAGALKVARAPLEEMDLRFNYIGDEVRRRSNQRPPSAFAAATVRGRA